MIAAILGVFVLCFIVERSFPGWALPRTPTWALRVFCLNAVQLGVVLVAGVSWERWAREWSLLQLSGQLDPVSGGVLAYVIATFVFYWWHRWRHESAWLWRTFHQIHHSASRLEVVTSFYKHPLEMAVNSAIGSLLVYACLGLSPEAGAVYTLCTALGEFFYHTNIRTPRWVGYVFQRPEMHRIHHELGRHRDNYGDLPVWDMLFGTFRNPATWDGRCGFDGAREQRLGAMLLGADLHADEAAPRFAPSLAKWHSAARRAMRDVPRRLADALLR